MKTKSTTIVALSCKMEFTDIRGYFSFVMPTYSRHTIPPSKAQPEPRFRQKPGPSQNSNVKASKFVFMDAYEKN